MCRWLAYSGDPIALARLIFDTENSLIDQSLSSQFSTQTTNGDGFGIGWYDDLDAPGLYRHIQPAWNDSNLKDLCVHIRSPMFMAHVRAETSGLVQRTNCHPFRFGRWLMVHNGEIRGYHDLRRELMMAIGEELYPEILGTTDSELMLYLALQFGMEKDVYEGVARMVGFVEAVGRKRGIEHPVQMTLGVADGERLYAFRYSSEHLSRTLYHSKTIAALRELLPLEFQEQVDDFSKDARAIVSEPLTGLPDLWVEIPESTFVTIENGEATYRDFAPL